jgi:hypothetical protein
MFGGSAFGCTVSLTVGTWYILTCIWDGASSSMQVNNGAAATGSIGTANQGAKIIVGFANDSVCGQWRFARCVITTSLDGTNLNIHKNWLANFGGPVDLARLCSPLPVTAIPSRATPWSRQRRPLQALIERAMRRYGRPFAAVIEQWDGKEWVEVDNVGPR